MSSESKKKRGQSGAMNAFLLPFRCNGRPQDWMARAVGAMRARPSASSGSRFMQGMLGGVIVQSIGRGDMVGEYESKMAHAQTRVTSPYLFIGEEQ